MTVKTTTFDAGGDGRGKMHRIAAVRRQQDISIRTAAKRLGKTPGQAKQLEDEFLDLPLSVVYKWQEALDVPMTELLIEPDDRLSSEILYRARLVRAMKSVMSLVDVAQSPEDRRLARELQKDLTNIMPELSAVTPWPNIGQAHDPRQSAREILTPYPDDGLGE